MKARACGYATVFLHSFLFHVLCQLAKLKSFLQPSITAGQLRRELLWPNYSEIGNTKKYFLEDLKTKIP